MEVRNETPALALEVPVVGNSIEVQDSNPSSSDASETPTHSGPALSATTDLPSQCLTSETFPTQLPTPEEVEFEKIPGEAADYIPVGVLRLHNTRNHGSGKARYPEAEVSRLRTAKWIRTVNIQNDLSPEWDTLRVFILPDDVCRGSVPRGNTALRRALKLLMSNIDTSPQAWAGRFDLAEHKVAEPSDEEESLFYIFNTLESPSPEVDSISDPYARKSIKRILFGGKDNVDTYDDDKGVVGLKTPLYPYQRRSAAAMIQRESQPGQTLDPRLQPFVGPTGQQYYYDKEEGSIVQEKRIYSEPCGGILAETMGYGKTLICLAVILSTKGHFPRIPTEYVADTHPVRKQTGSLVDMASATAGRFSLPWGTHFERLEKLGVHHERCRAACERNRGAYTIPAPVQRYKSRTGASSRIEPRHLMLSAGTLIVLPINLIDHWLSEIKKHTYDLKILVLRNSRDPTPSVEELLQFDVIIFAKARFDREANGCDFDQFVRGKEKKASPLTRIHWLRIIVDEGHNFAGHGQKTGSVHMLELLQVERRWVVSGTPSSGLYGAEVSLASQDTEQGAEDGFKGSTGLIESRRKVGSLLEEELKDLDKLRLIVVEFLNTKPWSNTRSDDPASWAKYMKPIGADGKRKKAPYLRSTLQSLVVRHRLDDIDNDITLPKLHNKVVYLEPTSYDKTSINLFIFILTVNAITSERTGEDYMFHQKNRKHLSLLISNLRHAGFWWTGMRKADIESTVKHAAEYLEKKEKMSPFDRQFLCDGITIAEKAINSASWNSFRELDELGVFVEDFPEHARSLWALDSGADVQETLLLGITQARQAQKFVTSRLGSADPSEGIAGAGIKARREIRETRNRAEASVPENPEAPVNIGSKKPGDNLVHRPAPEAVSPKKFSSKKSFSKGLSKSLPKESALSRSKFVATSSAKLTYLLQQVLDFHAEEKIIIFYEHNNFAFWIAEGLEMLGIEFRIYANTLKTKQRSEYLSHFNESEETRVLLMDLRQAAHGLHIACASRVFIVNPIWRPTIESQAIKRAHRISQKRPVFVETLVLEGTFEDKMLRRRKQMTNDELQHADKDLLDDSTMEFIVKNMGFLDNSEGPPQPAYLRDPPGFFDRHTLPVPDSVDTPIKMKRPPTPLMGFKRKAVPTFDLPQPDTNFSATSTSGETEPKRRKVTLAESIENDDSPIKPSKTVVLSPLEHGAPQIPPLDFGNGISEGQSNSNSEIEIENGDMGTLTNGLPVVNSLFGGPNPSPGFRP